ncbi:MAG: hypothetical protein NC124_06065 [Clostridium sp.]|nr:hypothetical protein [Clostridium sp.]
MKRKIALCIELKDAFTGKTVGTEDIRITVNGRMPVSRKEQRYYLFQDLQTERIEVYIKSKLYQERRCQIVPGDGNCRETMGIPGGTLAYIWGIPMLCMELYPNEKYIVPAGYVRREYRAAPFEEIRVVKHTGSNLLLAADYDGGEWIRLMAPQAQGIKGSWFRIQEGENREDFMLLEQGDGNLYRIDRALTKRYQKGSRLYGLYCARADGEGRAFAIVKDDLSTAVPNV